MGCVVLLMGLQRVLQTIRSAKRVHTSWVMKADAIIQGLPLDIDQVPMHSHECAFGQWYYGEGKCCAELDSFTALEKPHNELHDIYAELYSVIYDQADHSFISGLFGNKRKMNKQKLEKAQSLFPEFKKRSDILLKQLDVLERDVLNLPNAKNL